MVIECSHCGAPLDVREGATITKCVYCGRTDERRNFRITHKQTPRDFTPPPRWRPPAHVPADTSEEYEYKRESQWTSGWIVFMIAIGLATVVVPAIAILGARRPKSSPSARAAAASQIVPEVDPRVFDETSIDGTLDQLKQRFGGNGSGDYLEVPIRHATWSSVRFQWYAGFGSHPAMVLFFPREKKISSSLAAQVNAGLGVRVIPGNRWDWRNLRYEFGPYSVWCSVVPRPTNQPEDPKWKRKVVVAYSVLKEATLGQKSPVGLDERRELLGQGYPLTALAKIETGTTVDDAAAVVGKLLPGALITQKGKVDAFFSIDHPRVVYLTLTWQNARDATLGMVLAEPTRTSAKIDGGGLNPFLEDFSRCFSKVFGAPKVTDVDYLKKKKSYEFSPPGARLTLGEKEIRLSGDATGKLSQQTWTTFLGTLDGCR